MSDQKTMKFIAQQLLKSVKELSTAMRRAVNEGSVDHLDAGPDRGKHWHTALENADKRLDMFGEKIK